MGRITINWICLLIFLIGNAAAQDDELTKALARAQEIRQILDNAEKERP